MKAAFKPLPTFDCEHCDLKFQNKTTLKGHIRKVHSVKTLFFSCEDCEERFINKRSLLNHKISKHTEFKGNLLNVNVTTPHPIKETKKRKIETSSPEKEEKVIHAGKGLGVRPTPIAYGQEFLWKGKCDVIVLMFKISF